VIINYLEVEVKYAKRGKVKQSAKLGEWARVEFEKKRGNK
jgi:hypothetical protein